MTTLKWFILILCLIALTACSPSYHVICYNDTGSIDFEGDSMLYSPTDVITDYGMRDAKYKACKYEEI